MHAGLRVSGSGDSINLDLIDLNSSSSDPSSGEFYESSSVLRKARKTIKQTDKLLGSTRYFLRYRVTNTENTASRASRTATKVQGIKSITNAKVKSIKSIRKTKVQKISSSQKILCEFKKAFINTRTKPNI